jgi:hypothetical protein
VIFVPVRTQRNAFWDRLRDVSGLFLGGIISAATVVALVK